jgi:hypothetical protein
LRKWPPLRASVLPTWAGLRTGSGVAGSGEPADKPGSVEGNHSSGTTVTGCLERPTRESVRDRRCGSRRALPYLVLLRTGFTVPRRVTTRAVRSYRTVSPLPVPCGTSAVCFLLHFPWARAPQALPGVLSDGARTFLPARGGAIAWPAPATKLGDGSGGIKHLRRSPPVSPGPGGTGRYVPCR